MTNPIDNSVPTSGALQPIARPVEQLADDELVANLKSLVGIERKAAALIVAHLIEFDKRKLYAPLGYSSLFSYCTAELRYSEHSAFKRITAARAAAKFPVILRMLETGSVHLAAIGLLAPILTLENHKDLLDMATGRPKRDLEALLAEVLPEQERPDYARAVAPGRVRVSFTAGDRLRVQLERAVDLLRHKHPSGAYELVIGEALGALLEKLEPSGSSRRGRPGRESRAVPKLVKQTVWRRDEGRCAYVAPSGLRCAETGWLEFDHIIPWALGGSSADPENIRLLCWTHNQHAAREIFGDAAAPRAGLQRDELCHSPRGE